MSDSHAYEGKLRELAGLLGIRQAEGDQMSPVLGEGTLKSLVTAMLQTPVNTLDQLNAARAAWERSCWLPPVEPLRVIRQRDLQQHGLNVAVRLPEGTPVPTQLQIKPETGRASKISVTNSHCEEVRQIDGANVCRWNLYVSADAFSSLPMGYHQLVVLDEQGKAVKNAEMPLIVTPEKAYNPIQENGKGLIVPTVQLYGLRHENDWGIGDFTALKNAARLFAEKGAASIGLNPLHAMNLSDLDQFSPYTPSSRRFLNPIYIDVEALPEFEQFAAKTDFAALKGEIAELRAGDKVDYRRVTPLKLRVLRQLFDAFEQKGDAARKKSFEVFIEGYAQPDSGNLLLAFGVFQVLQAENDGKGWQAWTKELQNPKSKAVAQYADAHQADVRFYAWLQWLTFEQMQDAQKELPLGLYQDVAVGVDAGGFDAWQQPEVLCFGAKVGAPPDPLGPAGQDWGFPPEDPAALRVAGYRPYIEKLRANMTGMTRFDHAFQLARLFWIPQEYAHHGHKRPGNPKDGAYVYNALDEMMGILALESHRNRTLVIAEDLGTIPPGFVDVMRDWDLFGYDVQRWDCEWTWDGQPFRSLGEVRRNAARTSANADIPTLFDLIAHRYPDKMQALGCIGGEQRNGIVQDENATLLALARWLRAQNLIEGPLAHFDEHNEGVALQSIAENTEALVLATYRAMGLSSSGVVLVDLKEALPASKVANLVFNIPGTAATHEERPAVKNHGGHFEVFPGYPNWQARYPQGWEQEPLLSDIFARLVEARGNAADNLIPAAPPPIPSAAAKKTTTKKTTAAAKPKSTTSRAKSPKKEKAKV